MQKALVLTVWIATLTGAADAWAQQEPMQVRARRWRADLDGRIRADADGIPGTNIDTRSMLDLGDESDINDLGAVFHLPGLGRVNFQEWEGSFDAEGVTLGQDLVFAGSTFTAGTIVNSAIDWKVTTMMMEYDPSMVPFYGIPALVSVNAGVKKFRLSGKIASDSNIESGAMKGYVPVFGFHAKLQPAAFLSVEADVNSFLVEGFEVEGVEGTIVDMALSAQLSHSTFYGGVGYRWFKVKLTDDRTDVDELVTKLTIKGFFVELGVKF